PLPTRPAMSTSQARSCARGSPGCCAASLSHDALAFSAKRRRYSATSSSFETKCRYSVILLVPAASAMASTPIALIPCREKRSAATERMRSRGGIPSSFLKVRAFVAVFIRLLLDIGVTGQYLCRCYRSVPQRSPKVHFFLTAARSGPAKGSSAMKQRTLRGLQLLLGLVLFAAGSGQPGGLDLVVQQIEIMGARQWLGLMAGSVIAPVSQRVAGGFFHSLTPAHADRDLNANAARANGQPTSSEQRCAPKSPERGRRSAQERSEGEVDRPRSRASTARGDCDRAGWRYFGGSLGALGAAAGAGAFGAALPDEVEAASHWQASARRERIFETLPRL